MTDLVRCTESLKVLAGEKLRLVWARAPELAGSGGACANHRLHLVQAFDIYLALFCA